ncbi:PRC-barrel domain-containing protein [Paraburkholderia madseniana]|uniref:PRC-barrel domain-containing protein n=1 Tax=Paraburkholderia madseniana TaxID=2599607 RepID=UPI001F2C63EC|nr:PRC-barrel domain-containing protein [Paraburkholderia madseniana]
MTTIDEPRAGAGIVEKGRETAEGPGPEVMATSTLDGNKVLSTEGDDIGKLKDIMLDVRSGRIACGVLTRGSFLGSGDKLRAIPLHPRRIIYLDASRYHRGKGETLQSIQSFAAPASSMLDAKQPRQGRAAFAHHCIVVPLENRSQQRHQRIHPCAGRMHAPVIADHGKAEAKRS